MLTFICFVCLVIVILAIYQFRKNDSSATIEDFRNMNPDGWTLRYYGTYKLKKIIYKCYM